ncbi:TPA: hypothetical protein QC285_003692 [Bacillus cereus]|nr:hypothetical protein [Bacillus cereus]MED2915257.1 hypothetical protein [Bacillus thuringiensis]MED2922726.1 hypothetical protein [Bacillus thuringiensis]MED3050894.1 hypothetical protein [Bacillus thuringiensis]HDR8433902.1 hypothetical protein [Bacillus cereus]
MFQVAGTIVNATQETMFVYNSDHGGNGLYALMPGKRTADGWDCDGFWLPNDRHVGQIAMPAKKGPAAVKFRDYQTVHVGQDGDYYFVDTHNWGIFHAGEIGWWIDDRNYESMYNYLKTYAPSL